MAYVVLRDGEDGEALVKRFQSIIQRAGIMRELRDRRFFRSKGEQTRIVKPELFAVLADAAEEYSG